MAKKLNAGAFSLAGGYAYECLEDLEAIDELSDAIDKATTIEELNAVHPSLSFYNIPAFYAAMAKVNAYLRKTKDPIGEREYGGTEDRGWWRVWGAISRNDGYFCRFDLGRDQWMVSLFFDAGVITQDKMNQYKTLMTLRMACDDAFQTDGKPDTDKIVGYWRDDYASQVLDMGIIYALKLAQHNDVATLAMLAV